MRCRRRLQRSSPVRSASLVAVALCALVACTPQGSPDKAAETPDAPSTGATLVLGVVGEPPTLAPGSDDPEPTRWLNRLDGTWEPTSRTAGLQVVYEPDTDADPEPLLGRLIVRFVQTLDIALDLLDEGRL